MSAAEGNNGALQNLYEGNMVFNGQILCLERHQRSKVGYLSCDTKACVWGEKRDDASTCGDCGFAVKLKEFKPTYNPREVIREIEAEKKAIINVETSKKEIVVMYQ